MMIKANLTLDFGSGASHLTLNLAPASANALRALLKRVSEEGMKLEVIGPADHEPWREKNEEELSVPAGIMLDHEDGELWLRTMDIRAVSFPRGVL